MFSNGFISLVLALGAGGWTYAKSSRRTGGNMQSAMVAAVAVGILAFIVAFTLLATLF
jgi:hypothetical protein